MTETMEQIFSELESGNVDRLEFGVIGFDSRYAVRVYNRAEAVAAALDPERVLGYHVFESIAPCMNNYLVAQRFEDAAARGGSLDQVIDYVLTLRMKPTPVRLRLLADSRLQYRYILVAR